MILLTGAAGFIGYFTAKALLERGEVVVGIDSLTDYYDVKLKKARLHDLEKHKGFSFHKIDISDHNSMQAMAQEYKSFDHIVHLAAQAGVRYSLEAPFKYAQSNLVGHLVMLEFARNCKSLKHLVYASSSSVYGGNKKQPFNEFDTVNEPLSMYAATKRADELMSQSYSHLFGIPSTGLRFFTVYGPWGRPDMAYFSFTRDIIEGRPITINNHGDMKRDFTWIDDCVFGILGAMNNPPCPNEKYCLGGAPHRVVNIGNNKPENLLDFIALIEQELGMSTKKLMGGMAPGDVHETCADISVAQELYGYSPVTKLSEGIPRFIKWYREYYDIKQAA